MSSTPQRERLTGAQIVEAYDEGRRSFHAADLSGADLRGADLRSADLRGATLRGADLRGADLRSADLSGATLSYADLSGADLSGADLSYATLSYATLSYADLSGAEGLLDPVEWLEQHCERDADGLIVYKTFGGDYAPPPAWRIEPGAVISEVVNPDRGSDCACGINVSPATWQTAQGHTTAWRCRIRWAWLAGVIVPFGTYGKFRASRLELLEEVEL